MPAEKFARMKKILNDSSTQRIFIFKFFLCVLGVSAVSFLRAR
jgi:hypothetical protein